MLASLSHNCFAENSVLESDVLQDIKNLWYQALRNYQACLQ